MLLLSPNTCPLACPSLPSATNQDEDYGKDEEDVHGDDNDNLHDGDNAGWFCWRHTSILYWCIGDDGNGDDTTYDNDNVNRHTLFHIWRGNY